MKVLLLLGGEVLITMAIQNKIKNRLHEKQFLGVKGITSNKEFINALKRTAAAGDLRFGYGEIEQYKEISLGTLNHELYDWENQLSLQTYWDISPEADGTTAAPTIELDYRWNNKCLFINISTYAVTIALPDPTEVSIGFSIKFILSEASEGEATKNFGIITHDTGTDIQGYIGGGAAMNVTSNTSSVYWDTSDAAASGGDWCEVITDGTGWYITGQAALANSVDIADGHDVTT